MSKSYQVTRKDFRKLSKGEIDEMAKDHGSLLHQWADKSSAKREEIKKRKIQKQFKPEELWIYFLFAVEIYGEVEPLKLFSKTEKVFK